MEMIGKAPRQGFGLPAALFMGGFHGQLWPARRGAGSLPGTHRLALARCGVDKSAAGGYTKVVRGMRL